MPRVIGSLATIGAAALALTGGSLGAGTPSAAAAGSVPYCAPYTGSGIPAGSGIPPWGFHGTQAFGHGMSGYAHGWGDVNLSQNWISGRICEYVYDHGRLAGAVAVTLEHRIVFHSHYAQMWGYAGNVIKARVWVSSSTDRRCTRGTHGLVTMYASYNGVRSDSVQFMLGAGCRTVDRLFHGPQVDAQVPPL